MVLNLTILKTQEELNDWRIQQSTSHTINFVPTMGGLHKGHEALIKAANTHSMNNSNIVLVSIFVNPLQFGINEDFKKYPRTLDDDCITAYKSGANALWAPEFEDIFPKGENSHFKIKAPVNLTKYLCGSSRKKHFDGVATVVMRLLSLVKPKAIFLGEKDWQQLIIIRKLINDFGLPVKVKSIPTIRDEDDLACSSRNIYLSKEERSKAILLPKILKEASRQFKQNNSIDIQTIKNDLEKNDLKVEYVDSFHLKSLTPVILKQNQISLLAAAVRCGNTRLIDHTFLMKRKPIVAIDGPAGAGKSTIAKIFAEKLGLIYLDTGAMYRSVTWLIQEKDINIKDEDNLLIILNDLKLDIQLSDTGNQEVILNGHNITNKIRSPKVTAEVSKISALAAVRDKLTKQQKQIGLKGGLVAEGRDIGTKVFPDADLKIFLTASTKERAKRRSLDLQNQGFNPPNLLDLENEIKERDRLDSSREIAPLIKAQDAKELITDGMNIEKVIQSLIYLFQEEVPAEVWPTNTL